MSELSFSCCLALLIYKLAGMCNSLLNLFGFVDDFFIAGFMSLKNSKHHICKLWLGKGTKKIVSCHNIFFLHYVQRAMQIEGLLLTKASYFN